MNTKLTDGTEHETIRDFGDGRVLIKMRGLYVFADRVDATTYELSGEPARPGLELDTLNATIKHAIASEGETTLTITKAGDGGET